MTIALAMEFVEGDTLREKIHRERTPLLGLLNYLAQVAEDLAKAQLPASSIAISSPTT